MEADSRDLTQIVDEDLLRKMWQQTEDFGRKKAIRSHMYRLREARLREFYTTGEVLKDVQRANSSPGLRDTVTVTGKTQTQPRHAESLVDHTWGSLKSKEVRDSESPTRDVSFVSGNRCGENWSTITNEKSDDGKISRSTKFNKSEGSHAIDGGVINYAKMNESKSATYNDGDTKAFAKSKSESQHQESRQEFNTGSNVSYQTRTQSSSHSSSAYNSSSDFKSTGDNKALEARTCDITTEFDPVKGKVTKETKILPDGTRMTTIKYESKRGGTQVASNNFINEERRTEEQIKSSKFGTESTQSNYKTTTVSESTKDDSKTDTDTVDYSTIKRRSKTVQKTNLDDSTSKFKETRTNVDETKAIVPKTEVVLEPKVPSTPEVPVVRRPKKEEYTYKQSEATEGQYSTTYRDEFTNKRISIEISPTHDAFARSLRAVSPEDIQKGRSPPRKASSSEKIQKRTSSDDYKSSSFITEKKTDKYEDTDVTRNRYGSPERRTSRRTSPESSKKHYSSPDRNYESKKSPTRNVYDFINIEKQEIIKQRQSPERLASSPKRTTSPTKKFSTENIINVHPNETVEIEISLNKTEDDTKTKDSAFRKSSFTSSTISRQAYIDSVNKSKVVSREISPTKEVKRRSKVFDEDDISEKHTVTTNVDVRDTKTTKIATTKQERVDKKSVSRETSPMKEVKRRSKILDEVSTTRDTSPTKEIKRRSQTLDKESTSEKYTKTTEFDAKTSKITKSKSKETSPTKLTKESKITVDVNNVPSKPLDRESRDSSPTSYASDIEFIAPGKPVTDLDDSDIEIITEAKKMQLDTKEVNNKNKKDAILIDFSDQIVSNEEAKKPLKEKPLLRRSETYKERCRKILGMPEPKPMSKEEPIMNTTNIHDLYAGKEPVVEPPFIKKRVSLLGPDDDENKPEQKLSKKPSEPEITRTTKTVETTEIKRDVKPKTTKKDRSPSIEKVMTESIEISVTADKKREPSIEKITEDFIKKESINVVNVNTLTKKQKTSAEKTIKDFKTEIEFEEKRDKSPKKTRQPSVEKVTQSFIEKEIQVESPKKKKEPSFERTTKSTKSEIVTTEKSFDVIDKQQPLETIDILIEFKPEETRTAETIEVHKMKSVFEDKIKSQSNDTPSRPAQKKPFQPKDETPKKRMPQDDIIDEPKKRQSSSKITTNKTEESIDNVTTMKVETKVTLDSNETKSLTDTTKLTKTDTEITNNKSRKSPRKSPTKEAPKREKTPEEISKLFIDDQKKQTVQERRMKLEEKTATLKREMLNKNINKDIIMTVEQLLNAEKEVFIPAIPDKKEDSPKPEKDMRNIVEEIKIIVEEPTSTPVAKRPSQEFQEIQLELVPVEDSKIEVQTTVKETVKSIKEIKHTKKTLFEKEIKQIRPESQPSQDNKPRVKKTVEEKRIPVTTTTKKITQIVHLKKDDKLPTPVKKTLPKTPSKTEVTRTTKRVEKIIHLDSPSPKKSTMKGTITPRRLFTNGVDIHKETPNVPSRPITIATLTADRKLIPKVPTPKVCLKHKDASPKPELIRKVEPLKKEPAKKHVVTKTISLSKVRAESPKPETRPAPKTQDVKITKTPARPSSVAKSPTKMRPIKKDNKENVATNILTSGKKPEKIVIETTKSFKEPNKPQIIINNTIEYEGDVSNKYDVPIINITSKSVEMLEEIPDVDHVVVDLYRSKSSRESSPEKVWPVPVSPEEETGRPRYPDQIFEPDDTPIKKTKLKKIDIPLNEDEVIEEFDKITEMISEDLKNDESLLTVTEKVTKFTNVAEDIKTEKSKAPAPKIARPDFEVTEELKEDECLLSVSQKVSKFLNSSDKVTKKVKEPTPTKTIPEDKIIKEKEVDLLKMQQEKIIKDSKTEIADFLTSEITENIKQTVEIKEKQKMEDTTPIQKVPQEIKEPRKEISPVKKISTTEPKETLTKKHSRTEIKIETTVPQEVGISKKTQQYLSRTETQKEVTSDKKPFTLKSSEAVRKAKQMFESTPVDNNILNRPSIWEGRRMAQKKTEETKKVKLTDLGVKVKEEKPKKESPPHIETKDVTLKSTRLILEKKDSKADQVMVDNCRRRSISPEKDSNGEIPGYMKPLAKHDHKTPEKEEPETRTKITQKEPETISKSPKQKSPSPEKLLTEITTSSRVKQTIAEKTVPSYIKSIQKQTSDNKIGTTIIRKKSLSPERIQKTQIITEISETKTDNVRGYMKPLQRKPSDNNKYVKEITKYERREKSPSPEHYIIEDTKEIISETPGYMKPLQRRPSDNLKEVVQQKSPERTQVTQMVSAFTSKTVTESPNYMKPIQRKLSEDIKEPKPLRQKSPERNETSSDLPSYMKPIIRKPSDSFKDSKTERQPSPERSEITDDFSSYKRHVLRKTSDIIKDLQPETKDSPEKTSEVPSYMKPLERRPSDNLKEIQLERKFSSPERRTSTPRQSSPDKTLPGYMKPLQKQKSETEPTEDEDKDAPRAGKKFGVKLRRTDSGRTVIVNSTSSTVTERRRSSTTMPGQPVIEDIEDLELLEEMMEKAVGYEQRRRIRSQIRIVKKLISENKLPEKKVPSKSSSSRETHQTTVKKFSSKLREPEPEISHEVKIKNNYNKGMVTQTFETQTGKAKMSQFEAVGKKVVKTEKFQSKTVVSGEQKYATYKKSSPMFKQEDIDTSDVKSTDIITSSYGIGPTDENGLPLFGIRALRNAGREKVHVSGTMIQSSMYAENGRAPVGQVSVTEYSSEPRDLGIHTDEHTQSGIVSVTTTQSFGQEGCPTFDDINTKDLTTKEDEEARKGLSTKVTRRGSVKALSQKFIDTAVETSKTERQSYPKAGLILRTGSFGDSGNEAFIQHESTEVYHEKGVHENGERRRSSLNKSLESPSSVSLVLRAQKQTSKETGTTSLITKKFKTPVTETTEILDEQALRQLLEQCTNYEERKAIREKIRQIMADQEERTETTQKTEKIIDGNKTITKVSTTQITRSSSVQTNKPMSPFAKFRQLDKQNSLNSPPSSPRGAPMYKFTDPAVCQGAATVKERLLQWCQNKTSDYQNIKLENFSTSWADGLGFCALIHHFLPEAFDYHALSPKHRRHNFTLAFKVADEQAGIAPLLDVDDMVAMRKPDWKCVFTYVQSIYRRFKDQD